MASLVIPDWLLAFLAFLSAQLFWYRALASLIYNLVYGMGYKDPCAFVFAALGLLIVIFNSACSLILTSGASPLDPLLLLPLLGSLLLELPLLYLLVQCAVR